MRRSKWIRIVSALLASLLLVLSPTPFCLESSAYNGAFSVSMSYDSSTNKVKITVSSGTTIYTHSGELYVRRSYTSPSSTSGAISGSVIDSNLSSVAGTYEVSASPGNTMYAWVSGYTHNFGGQSFFSNVASINIPKPKCATPSPTISKVSPTSAKVSWSSITGASSYEVKYGTTSSCTSSITTSSTSYTISGVTAGSTVYAKVTAIGNNNYDDSSTSSVVSVSLMTTLSAPSPSVTANSQTQITVSWSSISHASSYTVAYGMTSACSSGTFAVSGTSKSITGLSANTTYYVKVMANTSETGYTSSGYSSVKSATTLKIALGAPTLNTITVTNSDALAIEFSKVTNANRYIIEYSTSSTFANKQTLTV